MGSVTRLGANAVTPTAIARGTRRRTGLAVTLALAGFVVALGAGVTWLAAGSVYGLFAALGSLAFYGSLLYVAWVLHVAYRRAVRAASVVAFGVGVLGIAGGLCASVLFAAVHAGVEVLSPESLLALQGLSFVATGVWFVGASGIEYGVHVVSTRVAYVGFVAGVGGILLGVGLLFGGPAHPAFVIGAILATLGVVPWALLFRSRLLARPRQYTT